MQSVTHPHANPYELELLPQRVLLSAAVAVAADVPPADAAQSQVNETVTADPQAAPINSINPEVIDVTPAEPLLPIEPPVVRAFPPAGAASSDSNDQPVPIDDGTAIGDLVSVNLEESKPDDPAILAIAVDDQNADVPGDQVAPADGDVTVLDAEAASTDVHVMFYSMAPGAMNRSLGGGETTPTEKADNAGKATQPADHLPVPTMLDGRLVGVSQDVLGSQDQQPLGQPAEVLG